MSEILGALGAGSLGTLLVRLTADATSLIKGVAQAEETLTKSSTVMLKTVGGLAVGIASSFTAIALAGIKFAADFEDSFLSVQKRMKGSLYDIQRVQDAFREMSKNMPVNVNEINKVGGALLRLGVTKENVVALTQTMVTFGEITHISAEGAAKDMVRFGNLLGIPQKELDRVANTVAYLGGKLTTTAEEVLDMTMKLGSMAKAAGISAPQIIGLAGGLSSVGVEAGRGGMAIGGMIADMTKAVASTEEHNEKLERFAATAGMTGEKFKVAFKTNATGALLSFFEGINQLQKRGGDVFGLLEKMGLDGNLVAKEILKAAGSTDLLAKSMSLSAKEWEKNNSLSEAAELRYKTFHNQLTILWNRVKDFLLTIGMELLPSLEMFNKWLLELTKSSGEFGSTMDEVAHAFGTVWRTTIGSIADAWLYFKVGFLAVEIALELAIGGLLTIVGGAVRGLASLIEAAVNGTVSGVNLLIRAINSVTDKLPPWAKPAGGGHINEIGFKLKVDATDADKLAARLIADAAAASVYLERLVKEGLPSDKLLKEYTKFTDGVKKKNDEIKKDLHETFDTHVENKATLDAIDAIAAAEKKIKGMKPLELPAGMRGGPNTPVEAALELKKLKESPQVQQARKDLEELKDIRDQNLNLNEESQAAMLKSIEEYEKNLGALKKAEHKMLRDAGQSIAESMTSIAKDIGGEQSGMYKAMFAASKAFAIAEATVQIAVGISKAIGLGWPLGLVAVAQVLAASATIVSSIKATQLTFAGGKATGGPVSPGSTFMVGEKGPELFSPSVGGTIIPNGRFGGGGSTKVVVNNYTDVQPRVTEKSEGNEKVIEVMIRRVKTEIGGDIRDGVGTVTAAMERSFGLKRGR